MKRFSAIGAGLIGLGAAMALLATVPACAQTIYPLNRAEILAGSRFDLKVEFPGAPAQGAVSVTINGENAATVSGKPAAFVEKEDGGDYSAYWIRGIALAKAGKIGRASCRERV